MAESGGSWWGSWYQVAKNKSAEVLEFVRRDLDEISSAVSVEASNVVNSTASVIKDKLHLEEPDSTASTVKRSISSFLGQVSNVLNPVPEDEDEEAMVIQGSEPIVIDRAQARLFTLIADPATFLIDPVEKREYEAWLGVVKEVDGEGIMAPEKLSALMASCPRLHEQYTHLVPSEVSHSLFWYRYLFRKALLEDEEARKEAKRKREEARRKSETKAQDWDAAFHGEENFATKMEISEEEQARLLSEYERECKEEMRRMREESEDRLLGTKEEVLILDADHYNVTRKTTNSKSESMMKDGENLSMREKKDMVLVEGHVGDCPTSSASSGDKESTDGDWEKEFDLEDTTIIANNGSNPDVGSLSKNPTTG